MTTKSLPWITLYGLNLNIIGLFASGIIAFYQLDNELKLIGLVPFGYGYKYSDGRQHCCAYNHDF